MRPITTIPTVALGLLLIACAGCKIPSSSGGGSALAPSATLSTTDYAQAISDEAASTGSNAALLGRVSAAASEALLGTASQSAGAAPSPAFARAAGSGSLVLDLATIRTGSRRLFPDATGSVTVAWTGTMVPSWPTGSSAVAAADVTLTLGQVVVVSENATFTIPSGVASMRMEADATVTDANNWVLTCTTATTVPAAAPISGTQVRAGKSTSLSIAGQRRATWTVTRIRTVDAAAPATVLIDRRDIGVVVGGEAIVGSSAGFSGWAMTRNGQAAQWNRKARLSWSEDLLVPVAVPTVTVAEDATYITATILGVTLRLGPYSAYDLARRLKLPAGDQGLLAAFL